MMMKMMRTMEKHGEEDKHTQIGMPNRSSVCETIRKVQKCVMDRGEGGGVFKGDWGKTSRGK